MNTYKVKIKDNLGNEVIGDIKLEKIEDMENMVILKSTNLTRKETVEMKEELKKRIGKEVLIINSPWDIKFLEIEKM